MVQAGVNDRPGNLAEEIGRRRELGVIAMNQLPFYKITIDNTDGFQFIVLFYRNLLRDQNAEVETNQKCL